MHGSHYWTSVAVTFTLCLLVALGGLLSGALAQQLGPTEETALAIQQYRQGYNAEAIKALKEVIKKHPKDALAWHYLGLSLVLKEDWKGARKAFEKAVALRPGFAASRANLANALLFTNASEAEEQARQALSLEPTNAEAHYVLGTVGLLRGFCADAIEQANMALSTNSNFPSAYLLRSQSFICEIAKNTLKPFIFDGTVFKTSVDSSEVSKEVKVLNAQKNALGFQKAAADLETFLKLAPHSPDASMWREQVETLRLYAEPAEKTESERSVFISSEVTTKARVLKKPEPSYTESARNAQVEGTVVLRAILAADGQIKNVLVLSRLPHGLTERALEAARKIKFQPAAKHGRPVSVFVQIEYNFNLY